jgi:hypothetical protein
MTPLLARLRMEHVGLAAMLRRAMDAGPGTTLATAILDEAKPFLLDHLRTEQEDLFAPLREAAAASPELREMLACPEAEQALRRATLLFTRQALSCSEAELAEAQEGLRARILWEETRLFFAYERFVGVR